MATVTQTRIDITAQNRAGGAFTALKRDIGQVESGFGRLKGLLAGLGAGLSVGAFGALVKGAINAADEMGKLSQRTGVATQQLTAYKLAADLGGTSLDSVAKSMQRLSRNMLDTIQGTGEAAKIFAALDVSVTDASGKMRSTDAVLRDISERFASMEDGAAKAAAAQMLLGKSGGDLIPMLNEGAAALDRNAQMARRLGLVLDDETTAAATRFNDNLTITKAAMSGIVTSVSAQMLPTFDTLAEQLVDVATNTDFLNGTAMVLTGTIKGLVSAGMILTEIFSRVGTAIGAVAASIMQIVAGEFAAARSTLSEGLTDLFAPLDGLRARLVDLWSDDALHGMQRGTQAIKSNNAALEDALRAEKEREKAAKDAAAAAKKLLAEEERRRREYERLVEMLEKTIEADRRSLVEMRTRNDLLSEGIESQAMLSQRMLEYERDLLIANGAEEIYITTLEKRLELSQKVVEEEERGNLIRARIEAERKAAEAIEAEWKRMTDSLESSITDALMRGFEGGENFARNLVDTIKNLFQTLILRPIVQMAVQPMAMGIGGLGMGMMMPGQASAGMMGGMGLDGLGMLTSLFGGGGTAFGSGLMAGGGLLGAGQFGALLGSAWGGITSGTLSGTMAGLGMAMPMLLPALAIGSMLFGGLFGGSNKPKANLITTSSRTAAGFSGWEDDVFASGPFGHIGLADKGSKNIKAGEFGQTFDAIAQLDTLIAMALTDAQTDAVKAALDGWSMKGTDFTKSIEERMGVIIDTVAGQYGELIRGIGRTAEEMAQALVSVLGLERMITDLDRAISDILDPVGAFKRMVQDLRASVDDASAAFDAAIETNDPTKVLTAAQTLQQAIVNRYQQEIALVQQLRDRIMQIQTEMATFTAGLQDKIAALGGDAGRSRSTWAGLWYQQWDQVASETDPARALEIVKQTVTTIDNWLASATAEITGSFQAQRTALEQQRSAITETHTARLNTLNEELAIAQSWVSVLDSARSMIERMRLSTANPMATMARLDLAGESVDRLRAQYDAASGSERSALGQRLLEAYNAQLGLAQEAYQRPSPEYQSIYNDIISGLTQIEQESAYEAAKAHAIQASIEALNDAQVQQLAGIDAQLLALSAQEQMMLDALHQAAAGYYQYSLEQGRALYERIAQDTQSQLDLLLDGLSYDAWMAQQQANMVDLLAQIRDSLNGYLSHGSSNSAGGTAPDVPTPTQPGSGERGRDIYIAPTITITGRTGDDVGEQIEDALLRLVPELKRRLAYA